MSLFIRQRPEAVAAHSPRVLTPAYYQHLYALEQEHGWFRGMRAFGATLLDPLFSQQTNWQILDAGCGTGSMLHWLRRYPNAAVFGVDLSPDALRFCRRRRNARLTQTSVTGLPFGDASFDLVVCSDVLQHLPELPGDGAALSEARRVLRPAGYLYVRTNSACGAGSPEHGEHASYRQYTRASLEQRVRAAGFTIERTTYANTLPSLVASLRRHPAQSHAHDTGLRLQLRPSRLRWIDALLALVLRAEAAHFRCRKGGLPFGSSLLLLARKPEEPSS